MSLTPEFITIVLVAVVSLAFLLGRYLRTQPIGEFYERWYFVVDTAASVIVTIARNADFITPEEWLVYEEEARRRNLDPRLIAAIHELDQQLQQFGIDIPEDTLLTLIEREYQNLINSGVLSDVQDRR